MDHQLVPLLLIPYCILLVWLLKRFRCGPVALIVLGVTTVLGVWGLLYATYNVIVFWDAFQPAVEVQSVEQIMDSENSDWLARYVSIMFGWAVGLLLFQACWLAAFVWDRRATRAIGSRDVDS